MMVFLMISLSTDRNRTLIQYTSLIQINVFNKFRSNFMKMMCPNCGSSQVCENNYGRKLGGTLGATGGVIGAIHGAKIGAKAAENIEVDTAERAVMKMACVAGGITIGVIGGILSAGVASSVAGAGLGKMIDEKVMNHCKCLNCGNKFWN